MTFAIQMRRLSAALACGLCLLTSGGCLTFIYAQGYYTDRLEQIRNTHTSITVSGQVVDEDGKSLPSLSEDQCGVITMTGIRHSVRFQMESEGAGDSTDLICRTDWLGENFSIKLDQVCEATLVFTREGYQPSQLRVVVRPGKNARPQPVVINDAVIVMHRATPPPQ